MLTNGDTGTTPSMDKQVAHGQAARFLCGGRFPRRTV
jgi:hypothetical protein